MKQAFFNRRDAEFAQSAQSKLYVSFTSVLLK